MWSVRASFHKLRKRTSTRIPARRRPTPLRILVTGGTGFIGSRLALRLVGHGHHVTAMGLEGSDEEAKNAEFLRSNGARVEIGSVTDSQLTRALVEEAEIVYHLAAAHHAINVPDQHFYEVNVVGTRNVVEGSIAAGVRCLVHASTIGVYGPPSNGAIDEDGALRPNSLYGKTKLEGERLVLSYRDQLPVVALRISETYGPGDRRLLKLFRAIKTGTFLIIGKGNNLHHPVFIHDLLDAFESASQRSVAGGRSLVIAGPESFTTNHMVETIAFQLGAKLPRFRIPMWPVKALAAVTEKTLGPLGIQPPIHNRRLDFFINSYTFGMEAAREVLGYSPATDFASGVGLTAEWYTKMGLL